MKKRAMHSPSPAMVLAMIALFVSLGGTGYAASQLSGSPTAAAGKASKGQKPKKPVKTLRGKTGPTGATGATGAAGAAGAQGKEGKEGKEGNEGKAGAAGATKVTVVTATTSIPSKSGEGTVAVCPAGSVATGGGVNPSGVTSEPGLDKSYPSAGTIAQITTGTPTAWGGWAYNPTGGPITLYVFAICASP